MNFNLVLACLWLAAGIGVLVYEAVTGKLTYRVLDTNISIGWLILLLALYNLARWWSVRSSEASRRAAWQMESMRHRSRADERRRDEPPDPNFQFTDDGPGKSPP